MKAHQIFIKEKATGFTLVELLVSMVVSGIVIGALYSAYTVQQKQAINQEQVTEMQQNLRSGVDFMVREIRLAGFDPTGDSEAGFVEIDNDALVFTADFNEDGKTDDAGENIGFYLYTASDVPTLGRTVDNDNLTIDLAKAAPEALAENIEKIEFRYMDVDNNETSNKALVNSIQISILARASRPDAKFTNTMTYTTAKGTSWTVNDHYRRRLLTTSVKVRNMGLVND